MQDYTTTIEWCGYTIKPRRDEGFVVVKDGVNVMPGATWFRTQETAMDGIAALIVSDGSADKFWALMRLARRNA